MKGENKDCIDSVQSWDVLWFCWWCFTGQSTIFASTSIRLEIFLLILQLSKFPVDYLAFREIRNKQNATLLVGWVALESLIVHWRGSPRPLMELPH